MRVRGATHQRFFRPKSIPLEADSGIARRSARSAMPCHNILTHLTKGHSKKQYRDFRVSVHRIFPELVSQVLDFPAEIERMPELLRYSVGLAPDSLFLRQVAPPFPG